MKIHLYIVSFQTQFDIWLITIENHSSSSLAEVVVMNGNVECLLIGAMHRKLDSIKDEHTQAILFCHLYTASLLNEVNKMTKKWCGKYFFLSLLKLKRCSFVKNLFAKCIFCFKIQSQFAFMYTSLLFTSFAVKKRIVLRLKNSLLYNNIYAIIF